MPPADHQDTRAGFLLALAAYTIWGFLPFYMKAVAHIPVAEIIAHRVVWSVPIAGAVLVALGRTADLAAALRSPRMIAMAAATAFFITINWGVYIWAIIADRTLETALGYYINPLFSVFMAAVVLRESLNRAQIAAIGLAIVGVAIITWDAGGLPWPSLVLACSWGMYALLRRALPIGPNQGFLLEVLILSIPSIGVIVWSFVSGTSHFGPTGAGDMVLLFSAGIVTAIPLILYANGAKRLKLSTIGLMQYIAPTIIFLIAVFAFGEPFPPARLVAFCFIWAALAVYSWGMLRGMRALPQAAE